MVRCRTSNQRVAGSIPSRGTLVCPWARQWIAYCLSPPSCKWEPSINKAVLRACALYAASCSGISPGRLKWFPCVQCLLEEEGRVSALVHGYKTINRIPLPLPFSEGCRETMLSRVIDRCPLCWPLGATSVFRGAQFTLVIKILKYA